MTTMNPSPSLAGGTLDPQLVSGLLADPRTREPSRAYLRAWVEATSEDAPPAEVVRRAEAAWDAGVARQRAASARGYGAGASADA
jgi:hypothetical protein